MKPIPDPYHKLVLKKTPSLYFGYATILAGIVCIASFIWILFDYDGIIASICAVSFIFCCIMCILNIIFLTRSRYLVNTTVNQQYPENLDNSNTVHDAFILVHSMGSDGIISGLDNLIHLFKNKKYPFRIYHCYSPNDFKAVLANENAKYLWIFGHGWRGGITFKWTLSIGDIIHLKLKKQTNFRYSNLLENGRSNYPPKDFIAQFHCNHISKKEPSNTALPQILMDENATPEMYYVSDNFNNFFSIWFATRKLVKTLERKPFDARGER